MDKKTGIVFVNRNGLFKGVAATLQNFEKGTITHVVGQRSLGDDAIVEREDGVFVDGELIFLSASIKNKKHLGCYPTEDMITLADAFDIVEPLYEKYPYLEIIMRRVAMDMFLSDGNDICEKMVDAAVWYEAYMPYTEEILSFIKARKN